MRNSHSDHLLTVLNTWSSTNQSIDGTNFLTSKRLHWSGQVVSWLTPYHDSWYTNFKIPTSLKWWSGHVFHSRGLSHRGLGRIGGKRFKGRIRIHGRRWQQVLEIRDWWCTSMKRLKMLMVPRLRLDLLVLPLDLMVPRLRLHLLVVTVG